MPDYGQHGDDIGMAGVGEGGELSDRGQALVRVVRVDEALEDYPAWYPAIPRPVYPAQPAMGNRAFHFELAVTDEQAGLQERPEGKPGSALRAEALDPAWLAVAGSTDRMPTLEVGTPPFVLRYLWVIEHRQHLICHRYLRQAY
jgi:hypothetical protein